VVDTAPAVPDTVPDSPPDTPSTPPAAPVVAITVDDDLLHIAPPAEVLAHLADEAGGPGAVDPLTWEFFAADGTVLSKVTDQATARTTLEPDAEATPPTDLDRQLLVDRIDAFLARVQVQLDRDLQTGMVAEHRRVPRLSGELPEVVAGLAAVLQVPVTITQPDSRNWVHNLGHRLRGR
jgi:hypothetical protein